MNGHEPAHEEPSPSSAARRGRSRRRPGSEPMRADARRNYERLVDGGPGGLRRRRAAARPWRPSPRRPGSASARSTATSPSGSTSSRPSTATDVDELVEHGRDGGRRPRAVGRRRGLARGLRAYAQGKRTFLNELREAFEKNPDLKLASRERIDGRLRPGATPGPGRRRRPHRHRRGRPHAADRARCAPAPRSPRTRATVCWPWSLTACTRPRNRPAWSVPGLLPPVARASATAPLNAADGHPGGSFTGCSLRPAEADAEAAASVRGLHVMVGTLGAVHDLTSTQGALTPAHQPC